MADDHPVAPHKPHVATQRGVAEVTPDHAQVRHLNQQDLARRWRISERSLERWRWLRQGPAYLKVGGHVVYRIEDVLAYEAEQRRRGGAA